MPMLKITGTQEEISQFISTNKLDQSTIKIEIVKMGSITDTELNNWEAFTEYQKSIIKEEYSKHPDGFFPNPFCALY
jgi:hypothetical protein